MDTASEQKPGAAKRPRLSLQIMTSCLAPSKGLRGYPINLSDPTTFNTLSNTYVTAIERSSALQHEPVTAINTLQAFSLETPADVRPRVFPPYVADYPETPVTALSSSPSQMEIQFPNTMTATPPLSATADSDSSTVFTFSSLDTSCRLGQPSRASPKDGRSMRRRINTGLGSQPPYTHSRSLHSILRNSPLPPRAAAPPPSPRRQSLRLQEKAAKRVEYNNPLTQEIVTNKYIKSHIDLLTEDASPNTPPPAAESGAELDVAPALTTNEAQDGGQTPGPFEDMRRKMMGLGGSLQLLTAEGGVMAARKRKRPEKRRQWRWTIGQDDEDDEVSDGAAASPETAAETAVCPYDVAETAARGTTTPPVGSTNQAAEEGGADGPQATGVAAPARSRRDSGELSTPNETEMGLATAAAARRSDADVAGLTCDSPAPRRGESGEAAGPA